MTGTEIDNDLLRRLAEALERMAPPPPPMQSLESAEAYVWQTKPERLMPVHQINRLDLDLLKGIEQQIEILQGNTERFAEGFPANNALLWGARGTGKSSLVKSIHARVNEGRKDPIILVEIHREDIPSLPRLLQVLGESGRRCLIFCDDLSFDEHDTSFKSLKAVLEGGVEGRPENILFYATSNRRHLMPRDMIENEGSTAINPGEAVEENVSLSDRFGLWLGFHPCNQDTYFAIIDGYVDHYGIEIDQKTLRAEALEWSMTRGGRSGRVAWQYFQDLAGRLGKKLD